MTRTEIQTKIELYRRELMTLENIKIGCGSCEHGSTSGWCNKFNAAPPADVQAVGCDEWKYDEIPF